MLPLGDGGGDPAELLAALTAMSSGVTKIGTTTVRGVPVTGFAIKAAGTSLTVTTDFYDFGVPVLVSAPPAAEAAGPITAMAFGGGCD
jgi:hypothetical protein